VNQDILKRMIAGRAGLLLDEPFFGVPALRLAVVEDPSCPTAWTDGQSLGYNPQFVASLSFAELKALWIHEVEHCAMGHPWRREGRDHEQFNEAADLAINGVLRQAGYTLPEGALFPEQYGLPDGRSVEWYFPRMPPKPKSGGQGQEQGQGQGQPGQGAPGQQQTPGKGPSTPQAQGKPTGGGPNTPPEPATGSGQPTQKPNRLGEVRDAPKPDPAQPDQAPPSEEDWRQLMQQAAAMARAQGRLPASLDRTVEQISKSRIDWRPAMRRFAQEVAKADFSWTRPNPRYVAQGVYLPALRSEAVGVIVAFVDSSGSVDDVLTSQFVGELQAVADEVQPRKIIVASIDAKVQTVEEFERGEPIVIHPKGGGGTDFRPAFEYVAKMDEPPVCVIYLTDLAGTFPEKDPGIPTLWVTGREEAESVPFGELVLATN